jgi:hypothetical protein
MRHPKSTSHISGLIAFAGIALFAGCAPPGHVGTGAAGSSGTAGTSGGTGGSG